MDVETKSSLSLSSLSSTSSLGRLLGLLALSPPPFFLDLEDAAAFGLEEEEGEEQRGGEEGREEGREGEKEMMR